MREGSEYGDARTHPVFALSRPTLSALPSPKEPLRVIASNDESPEAAEVANQVRTFLEMVVLGATAQLSSFLGEALYIGPLRAIPPRGFLYERPGRLSSWADGLAAWELLLADRPPGPLERPFYGQRFAAIAASMGRPLDPKYAGLVAATNYWLGRLDAGCSIEVQELIDSGASAEQITEGHVDQTARRLLLRTGTNSLVLPSEVGAGLSQVIPIIVATLANQRGIAMVEQPELHIHPAMQVELGDLFIESATGEAARRSLLVETHSEHLILRLLRRIRETASGERPEGAPALTPDGLSVLYVENKPEGVEIRRLRVDESGEFVDRWPRGFFVERAEELF